MNLFEKPAPVTAAPSSSGCHKKLAMYLIGLLVVILCPAMAAAELNTVLLQRNSPDLNYIKDACNLTLYRRVCVASLASYASLVRGNQGRLVRIAVEISLAKARNATFFVSKIARTNTASHRERGALSDCVDTFQDAVDQVQDSLSELKKLKPETFQFQMGNVQTWMSAALTDQDTCLDGFEGDSSGLEAVVAARVNNVCKYTSNALALINKYAETGVHGLRA